VNYWQSIETVADRIAQMVVTIHLEPQLEPLFDKDSYGYHPNKSALDAVTICRQRCWKRKWVIDLDIKGFFDTIDHELLLKAVAKHAPNRWVMFYVEVCRSKLHLRWWFGPPMPAYRSRH